MSVAHGSVVGVQPNSKNELVAPVSFGKNVAAVTAYWNQQIFSGRGIPPVEKENDAQVAAMVHSTPGAIGYVSDQASIGNLRVIQIR